MGKGDAGRLEDGDERNSSSEVGGMGRGGGGGGGGLLDSSMR